MNLKSHDFYFPLAYSKSEGRKNMKDKFKSHAAHYITYLHTETQIQKEEKFNIKWSHMGKI